MMFCAHDPQHAVAEFAAAEGSVPAINVPNYEDAYGMALMQLNRPADAKMHFQRVLKVTKDHPGFRAQRQMAESALKKI